MHLLDAPLTVKSTVSNGSHCSKYTVPVPVAVRPPVLVPVPEAVQYLKTDRESALLARALNGAENVGGAILLS